MSDDPAHEAFKWECRRKQIESLRIPWEGMGAMANAERCIAALTIQNLMDEIEAWRQAMQKAERDLAALRDQLEVEESAVNHLHTDRNNLRLEIERLLSERDEARREVCSMNETGLRMNERDKKREAKRRGWDCFKENINDC